MGCLCNQKEIRHQLLTLAGCRVPSRCCLSLLVLGVEQFFVVVFFALDIIVLVNLLFRLIESLARPQSFANADRKINKTGTYIYIYQDYPQKYL